jgi:hypothetical protein
VGIRSAKLVSIKIKAKAETTRLQKAAGRDPTLEKSALPERFCGAAAEVKYQFDYSVVL